MKKTALLALVAALVVPASALANAPAPTAALAAPMIALPVRPPVTQALPCHTVLSSIMQKMKTPEYKDEVGATAMVMARDEGYAESCRGGGEGFCDPGTDMTIMSDELAGSMSLTEYRSNNQVTLGFRLAIIDGVAKIKWRFKGKSYTGEVDACSGGYWTAATSTSAIVVRVENPSKVEPPPG